MISDKHKKVQQIQKIQKQNIHMALMNEHKLDILKDKSKDLELKAKLFFESNEQIKKNKIHLQKQWQLILIGGILFGLASVLLGLAWPYCIFNAVSGSLIGYAISETAYFINRLSFSDLPILNTGGLEDLMEIELKRAPNKINQGAFPKTVPPIRPNFDKTTKKIDPLSKTSESKNSHAFKK